MQIDLLVNSLTNDMTRVATLQYMRSVGQAQMRWLGIEEGHHSLSHEPDNNKDAYDKLKKINTWFCGELAYLAKRLTETPEPTGDGSMLDHTLIVWTNELGKGNSHTLDNIPLVLVGGGAGFKMGRALTVRQGRAQPPLADHRPRDGPHGAEDLRQGRPLRGRHSQSWLAPRRPCSCVPSSYRSSLSASCLQIRHPPRTSAPPRSLPPTTRASPQ